VKPGAAGLLSALLLLPGCQGVGEIAGVSAGVLGGTATGSPAAGFAIGIAANAGVDELVKWFGRSRQNAEQDAMADVAGRLAVGQTYPWHIHHTIPIGNEHGELMVVGYIPNPLATCKELIFSVDEGSRKAPRRNFYTTSVCWQGNRWKWAQAEPAVQRWGYLQ
jgi:hypothetical protein